MTDTDPDGAEPHGPGPPGIPRLASRSAPPSGRDTDRFGQVNQAHIDCAPCGAKIHFGPAVLTPRNTTDPALDDPWTSSTTWHHTSTDADWPSGTLTLPKNEDYVPRHPRH
jgi:hypothetical protein